MTRDNLVRERLFQQEQNSDQYHQIVSLETAIAADSSFVAELKQRTEHLHEVEEELSQLLNELSAYDAIMARITNKLADLDGLVGKVSP